MDPKSDEQETAEAVRWYVRLRADDCSLAERHAFHAWLTQSRRHARAYERAKSTSRQLNQLAERDPRMRQLVAAALKDQAGVQRHFPWRVAAALLLGIGLLAMLLQAGWQTRPEAMHYANGGASQQQIDLADGSHVYLDVGARLDVQMTRTDRILALHSGRAYFEVAHDRARPFAVVAGGVRTVALGTRFQVALAAQEVTVTLAEGSVAVSPQKPSGWSEVLRPGEQLQIKEAGRDRTRREVDAAVATAWSTGRLLFKGAPLVDVLDEINRYSPVKLRLGDESLGKVPVGGTFIAGADSAQVATALAAALPLNAVQVGAREIVLVRRYETAD